MGDCRDRVQHTCCSCWSFKLLPTIIFSTMNSSPLLIYPSLSMSYTLNANLSFSSLFPLELNALRPETNSWKSTSPPPSSSKMAIMRVAKGFEETCGSERNSSRSIVPLLSLSSFMNRLRSLSTSSRSTGRVSCQKRVRGVNDRAVKKENIQFDPCTMFSSI